MFHSLDICNENELVAILATNKTGTSEEKKDESGCKYTETEAVLISTEIELILDSILFVYLRLFLCINRINVFFTAATV